MDLESCLHQLEFFDWQLRKAALQELASYGSAVARHSDAVAARLLEDSSSEVRKAAAATLASLGPDVWKSNRRVFLAALRDVDSGVRTETLQTISVLGSGCELGLAGTSNDDAICAVTNMATDTECVALAAIQCLVALNRVSSLAPSFISDRVTAPVVRRSALVQIARCPNASRLHIQRIVELICDADASVRVAAIMALGDVGPDGTGGPLSALDRCRAPQERQVKVRRAAVQALGKFGSDGISQLLAFLSDPDDEVRHLAAHTLGGVGGADAAAGAAQILETCDAPTRRAALQAFGRMGSAGWPYVDLIVEQLNDIQLANRLAACQALGELGTACAHVAERLGKLNMDPHIGMRQAAIAALAKMEAKGAEQVVRFLQDDRREIRAAAVKVFSPLHSKMPPDVARLHVQPLVQLLSDEDWRVCCEVAKALGDLRAEEFAEVLAETLAARDRRRSAGDMEVRRAAASALGKFDASIASSHLAAFRTDSDNAVRAEAERSCGLAEALTASGGGGAAEVRRAIASPLGKFEASAATPRLAVFRTCERAHTMSAKEFAVTHRLEKNVGQAGYLEKGTCSVDADEPSRCARNSGNSMFDFDLLDAELDAAA